MELWKRKKLRACPQAKIVSIWVNIREMFSVWFTLFVASTDVHEQLPHQLPCHLIVGSSLRRDGSIFGGIVPSHLKADSVLGQREKSGEIRVTTTATLCCFTYTQHTQLHSSLWVLGAREEVKFGHYSRLTPWWGQSGGVYTQRTECVYFCASEPSKRANLDKTYLHWFDLISSAALLGSDSLQGIVCEIFVSSYITAQRQEESVHSSSSSHRWCKINCINYD